MLICEACPVYVPLRCAADWSFMGTNLSTGSYVMHLWKIFSSITLSLLQNRT